MKYAICFDLGGSRIKGGIVNADGHMQQTTVTDIADNSSLQNILIQLDREIEALASSMPNEDELAGIGLALPCFVDTANQKVLSQYVKYQDAADIDLTGWARRLWSTELCLHNDAKAALLGEWKYGAGQGTSSLAMVTFGTGIGSAVVLENKLLDGKNHIAGNLMGHSILSYDGRACNCGAHGCAESLASTWSLMDQLNRHRGHYASTEGISPMDIDIDSIDGFKSLFDRYQSGHPFYQYAIDQLLKVWGAMIVNIVLAYNPERIVCGGGIMRSYETILPYLTSALDEHGWIDSNIVELVPAEQPEYAALLGLGYECLHKK